jgi:ribosome-binding protein aMBF1 (putative translation factor)
VDINQLKATYLLLFRSVLHRQNALVQVYQRRIDRGRRKHGPDRHDIARQAAIKDLTLERRQS